MDHQNGKLDRKLRMGLVGGGDGAFIGRVHAIAATMDGRAKLVAGALSSDPAKAKASAPGYDIKPARAYGSYTEMIDQESKLPVSERIDFVTIATPNHVHFEVAKAAIEAGFNVVCDKPMTFDVKQAELLVELVERHGVVFALTHNYTGYPLVRQARQMVLSGELGVIQAVRVCYIQGWLRTRLEMEAQKQAVWRTDPKQSGKAGCFGDIGVHGYNTFRYITDLMPQYLRAHLRTYEPGRQLDDYGHAVLFCNDTLCTITASQISHGRENGLWIQVDGTKKALEWQQENPNELIVLENGQPRKVYTRAGGPYLSDAAKAATRIPSGHPEGYLAAFANIYTAAYDAMVLRATGQRFPKHQTVYPNVLDGLEGMRFIEECVASSAQGGQTRPFPTLRN